MIEFKNKLNETADTTAGHAGNNCNAMHGSLRRNEHGNNVFAKLKQT